jgi:hypothetical protein
MPIKTFRGLIADGAQDTVSLHTNDGSTGYKIKKFEIITTRPGFDDYESIIKIYSVPQSTVDSVIDFSSQDLVGVAFQAGHASSQAYPTSQVIIFDNNIFNQDIYITHTELRSTIACNYYIELEQVSLDLNENTVATLKDIRNVTDGL